MIPPTPSTPEPPDNSDDILMRRALQGDTAAFGCLVRAYEKRVTALACRMLNGDRTGAEDIAQEAFLRVWRSRTEYAPQGNFSTYLFRVTCRLCLDACRKKRRIPAAPLDAWAWDVPDPTVPAPATVVEAATLADAVRQAVSALPDAQKAVFVLSHYDGLPYHEIARILDCPMGTVASRRHQAVQTLRRVLAPWLIDEDFKR